MCGVHSHPDTLTHTLTNCIWVTVHPTSSIYSQVEGVSANNHECFHVLDILKNEREMLLGIPLRRLHQHPPRIHLVIMIHQHVWRFLHLASEKPGMWGWMALGGDPVNNFPSSPSFWAPQLGPRPLPWLSTGEPLSFSWPQKPFFVSPAPFQCFSVP